MAFTYDTTFSTDLAKIRFLIQDTVSGDPCFTDEEITFQLSRSGSINICAADLCARLAVRYSRLVTQSDGAVSANYSDLHKQCLALEQKFRTLEIDYCYPICGGLVIAETEISEADTTIFQPHTKLGQFDSSYSKDGSTPTQSELNGDL